jgi:RNA polymerase sigma-70 factor (ECF subfamily)
VTVNKVRNYRRKRHRRPSVGLDPADGFLERLSDPNGDLAREWDRDHDRYVVEKLLSVVQPDFSAATWEAFRRFGVDGVPAGQVARELGLSENAVILAKSRVLRRLTPIIAEGNELTVPGARTPYSCCPVPAHVSRFSAAMTRLF